MRVLFVEVGKVGEAIAAIAKHRKWMWQIVLAAVVMLNSSCSRTTAAPTSHPVADSVFKNGYIYTVDKAKTVVQAIAVKGDTIVYVGDDAGAQSWIGPNTEVTDLGGKLVLPGFVDSHAHAILTVKASYEVFLFGIDNVDDYQQAIKKFMKSHSDYQALRGMGWVNAVFGPQGPTKEMLDEVVPNIPAIILSEDGHSVWVNSKTLEMAGIAKDTVAPAGRHRAQCRRLPLRHFARKRGELGCKRHP